MLRKPGEINSRIKAVVFDLDDTLFDSTGLVKHSRLEACKAMINAGLRAKSPEAVYEKLSTIVHKLGSHRANHYNELVKYYNGKIDPKIIAAGVVAYHNVKVSQIKLYPKARELLLSLAKKGFRLILVTKGVALKQWEKILRLEIAEFFDEIIVVEVGNSIHTKKDRTFIELKKRLTSQKILTTEVVAVGNSIVTDIVAANKAGFVSVRVLQGKYKNDKPKNRLETPVHTIQKISDLWNFIRSL